MKSQYPIVDVRCVCCVGTGRSGGGSDGGSKEGVVVAVEPQVVAVAAALVAQASLAHTIIARVVQPSNENQAELHTAWSNYDHRTSVRSTRFCISIFLRNHIAKAVLDKAK